MKKNLKLKKQLPPPPKVIEVRKLLTGEYLWAIPATGFMHSMSINYVNSFFKTHKMEFFIQELDPWASKKYQEFILH